VRTTKKVIIGLLVMLLVANGRCGLRSLVFPRSHNRHCRNHGDY